MVARESPHYRNGCTVNALFKLGQCRENKEKNIVGRDCRHIDIHGTNYENNKND